MSLRRTARVLRRLTVIHLSVSFTYRGELAFFALATLVIPIVSLLLWQAAVLSGAELPIGPDYLATYFVLVGLVTMATSSWTGGVLGQAIRLGQLSSWLIRPGSRLLYDIGNNLAEKALKSAVVLPVIALLWWVFADTIGVPGTLTRWLLMVLTVVLGAVLVFSIDVMLASLAFWFDDTTALNRARFTVAAVLSGQIVPLALMPDWSRWLVDWQPFRFTISFPIEIVIGDLGPTDTAIGLAVQVGYTALAVTAAVLIWRRGLRSYTAVGA